MFDFLHCAVMTSRRKEEEAVKLWTVVTVNSTYWKYWRVTWRDWGRLGTDRKCERLCQVVVWKGETLTWLQCHPTIYSSANVLLWKADLPNSQYYWLMEMDRHLCLFVREDIYYYGMNIILSILIPEMKSLLDGVYSWHSTTKFILFNPSYYSLCMISRLLHGHYSSIIWGKYIDSVAMMSRQWYYTSLLCDVIHYYHLCGDWEVRGIWVSEAVTWERKGIFLQEVVGDRTSTATQGRRI